MATQGTATIDFGSTPVDEDSFDIADATLSGLTYAEAWFMRDTTVGLGGEENNEDAHEQIASRARTACSISGTTLTVYVEILVGFVTGKFKLRYVAN